MLLLEYSRPRHTKEWQGANDGFVEHARYYVPDTSQTRAELGVMESYLLEQQISRYADWMIEGEDD